MAKLRITQVRGTARVRPEHRGTLRALGLRHHQQTVTLKNTASARGMIYKVRHLVEVTPVSAKR